MKQDNSTVFVTIEDATMDHVAGAGLLFPDIVFPSFNFGGVGNTTTTPPPAKDPGLLGGLLALLGL